jgi:hypothetical protein
MNAFDDLLAAAGRVDEVTPEQLRRASVPVRTALSAGPSAAPITSRRPRGSLRRRLTLTGAAAAVTAGVATVSVVSLGAGQHAGSGPGQPGTAGPGRPAVTGSGQPTGYTTAAMLLRAAGEAAGAQPGGWPHAAYWHTVSVRVYKGRTLRDESWEGHHVAGVMRDSLAGPGVTPDTGPAIFGEGLSWDQLYALPTDPAKLGAMLSHEVKDYGPDPNPTGGVSADQEEFVEVGDLLRDSPASPALRKALYDVAAGIPGVRLVGYLKDAVGRTGVGVEFHGEGTMLIDPATGQLLEEFGGNDIAGGAVYLSQGPASTAPAVTPKG